MQDYILPHSQEKTETRKEGSGATTGIGCRHGHASLVRRSSLVVARLSLSSSSRVVPTKYFRSRHYHRDSLWSLDTTLL
jgi:hypothetical protein